MPWLAFFTSLFLNVDVHMVRPWCMHICLKDVWETWTLSLSTSQHACHLNEQFYVTFKAAIFAFKETIRQRHLVEFRFGTFSHGLCDLNWSLTFILDSLDISHSISISMGHRWDFDLTGSLNIPNLYLIAVWRWLIIIARYAIVPYQRIRDVLCLYLKMTLFVFHTQTWHQGW